MENAMQTSVTPTYRSAEAFINWLGKVPACNSELLDWCYYGFGRGRGSDETHIQLISALPIGGDSYLLRKKLAERIATVLQHWPDLSFPYPGYETAPAFLIYQLLSLASQLNCPDILFETLWRVRTTLLDKAKCLPPPADIALTKALIHNQGSYHQELLSVWEGMVDGKVDPVLGGTFETGLEGISMMPGREDPEKPDRSAVGRALLRLAVHYAEDVQTRRQRFRSQLIWLKNLWALRTEYFIQLAHDSEWVQCGQAWAVDALPDLFVTNFGETKQNDEYCALVWRWFAACLKPWAKIKIEKELCGGRVLQVRFSAKASTQFNDVLAQIRGLAHLRPEISEKEMGVYVGLLMQRILQALEKQHRTTDANILEKEYQGFLWSPQKTSTRLPHS